MAVKEPFVIDLFDGKYFGAWTGEFEEGERGGRRPVIRRMGHTFFKSLLPFLNSTSAFNYEIDPDVNVKTHETMFGLTFKILIPTETVPKCNVEDTVWGTIRGTREDQIQEMQEKLDDRQKRIRKLRRKVNRLNKEQADQEKYEPSASTSKEVACPKCGTEKSHQWWTANVECPECETKHPKYKDSS